MAGSRVVNPTDRSEMNYAVGVPCGDGFIPRSTYLTEKEMLKGLDRWRKFAEDGRLILPLPLCRGVEGGWEIFSDGEDYSKMPVAEDISRHFALV